VSISLVDIVCVVFTETNGSFRESLGRIRGPKIAKQRDVTGIRSGLSFDDPSHARIS